MALPLQADTIRIGLFHTELERKAPGLLFRDILRQDDDITAAIDRIVRADADVIVLLDFDYDHYLETLRAFANAIHNQGGPDYLNLFALRPNTGMPSHADLNKDGRLGTPKDAQGYGRFSGQGGMAMLSTFSIKSDKVEDYSDVIWSKLDWASLPQGDGVPFYSSAVAEVLRLSTTGHWVVPVAVSDTQTLHFLVYHASPPAFDGPEDRNGLRNADETTFWVRYLAESNVALPVLVGGANLDPNRGDGRHEAISDLLGNPALQDPFGDAFSSVDWTDIGLGQMRSDYVLPAAELNVIGSGAIWPDSQSDIESRHALIWVDVELPAPAAPEMLETSFMTQ